VKVLTRTARTLTIATVAAACAAGTLVAHDLPAARARDARDVRAEQWRAAAAGLGHRQALAARRNHVLRARYDALVRRARRRELHLYHLLERVRDQRRAQWSAA
jgi:hypothetical protein